jgi:tetratricopeptide (TPR) repeat protein
LPTHGHRGWDFERGLLAAARNGLCAALAGALASSCVAVRAPETEPAPVTLSAPDEASIARAEGLASFAQGVIQEYHGDFAGAISNYQVAAAADPDNEELQLRVAVGLIQLRRPEEAAAAMEDLARRKPRSERTLAALAAIYRATDQTGKAEDVYRQLNRVNPKNAVPYIELASLMVKRGDEAGAIRLLEVAAERVGDPKDLLRVLGGLYARRATVSARGREEDHDRRSAVRVFERALRESPDDLTLLLQLADLYIQDGEFERALSCFERVEARNPDNLQLKRKLALSFLSSGNATQAIERLETLSREQPSNARLRYYLGEVYSEKGDRGRALQLLSEASALAPTDAAPYLRMAVLQVDTNADRAVEILEEGLRRIPDHPRLSETLAYVLFGRKQYEEACEFFVKTRALAEAKSPGAVNPGFYLNHAIASQMANRIPEAAELLARAVSVNAGYLDAYLQYVFRHHEEQTRERALAVLEKLGELQPDQASVYVYVGLINSYLKSYPEAIESFEKAELLLADSPRREEVLDAGFHFWFGSACERDGQIERAEKLFRKCLDLEPDHADALNYLAYMWAERGRNLDEALRFVKKAIEIKPDSGAFIDTLGWVYYMQEDYAAAFKEVRRANELIGEDPTILDHLGDVLYQLGDEQQALPHWKKAFLLDPENAKVAEKLTSRGVDLESLRREAEKLKQERKEQEARGTPLPGETEPEMDEQLLPVPAGPIEEPAEPEVEPAPAE